MFIEFAEDQRNVGRKSNFYNRTKVFVISCRVWFVSCSFPFDVNRLTSLRSICLPSSPVCLNNCARYVPANTANAIPSAFTHDIAQCEGIAQIIPAQKQFDPDETSPRSPAATAHRAPRLPTHLPCPAATDLPARLALAPAPCRAVPIFFTRAGAITGKGT